MFNVHYGRLALVCLVALASLFSTVTPVEAQTTTIDAVITSATQQFARFAEQDNKPSCSSSAPKFSSQQTARCTKLLVKRARTSRKHRG
jgi:hypothetical protein